MLHFLCRTKILHGRQTTTTSQSYKLFYMIQNDLSIFRQQNALRCMSTTSNQQSFTVSYLINKLGFSPKSAQAASNYVHLKTPNNPDSVISFLEEHGFSKFQIKTMVSKAPKLLASDSEKTLLPKLKFLLSKGFSSPDLAKLLSYSPTILLRSLDRQIIPFFSTYSNLIHSNEKTVYAIKRYPYLISYDMNIINGHLLSNINLLRDHGMPESHIIKLLYQFPRTLLINPGSLKEIVEKVKETGLSPLILKFVHAVSVLAGMSKSTRERKVDVCKKWGWSEKESWECFRKYPFCFAISEGKIMAKMDFVVNKMGLDSSRLANQPSFLRHSLEKRIVPRGLIAQHLLSKGLIKDFKLSVLYDSSEELFLKMFVNRFVAEAPELLELYEEKLKE
ncbi:transcription termination factor MTERF6, chloroplastic/mitochondrial-like isoform X1 [Durio zibethinus]|uniref:Transcription termination factor MTERF6, chloroplastic/mitochondrial-like isoform X1 n=1 Tax=Durio zibethinus TaxID=66656 RepID=A0A6P5X3L3_DURZI|nr:transcription termination factor MTERF6, chloroplastic/mitochondrial-like isoform X1 [Durio zibethinus]